MSYKQIAPDQHPDVYAVPPKKYRPFPKLVRRSNWFCPPDSVPANTMVDLFTLERFGASALRVKSDQVFDIASEFSYGGRVPTDNELMEFGYRVIIEDDLYDGDDFVVHKLTRELWGRRIEDFRFFWQIAGLLRNELYECSIQTWADPQKPTKIDPLKWADDRFYKDVITGYGIKEYSRNPYSKPRQIFFKKDEIRKAAHKNMPSSRKAKGRGRPASKIQKVMLAINAKGWDTGKPDMKNIVIDTEINNWLASNNYDTVSWDTIDRAFNRKKPPH